MGSSRLARWVFSGLILLTVAQMALYYPRLPERVASHFDAHGTPNGWSSKRAIVGLQGGLLALWLLIFGALPRFMHRLPPSLINIPHRDYWLAPERRSATLDRFSASMFWFGSLTQGFTLILFEQTYRFNLGSRSKLGGSFWFVFVGYLIANLLLIIRFYRSFRPPDPG